MEIWLINDFDISICKLIIGDEGDNKGGGFEFLFFMKVKLVILKSLKRCCLEIEFIFMFICLLI